MVIIVLGGGDLGWRAALFDAVDLGELGLGGGRVLGRGWGKNRREVELPGVEIVGGAR